MAISNIPKQVAALQSVALGQNGAYWLDTAGVDYVLDCNIIVALKDTVFTTLLTSTVLLNAVTGTPANLNGKELLKGLPLYGRFTKINLQSGAVIAYASGDAV